MRYYFEIDQNDDVKVISKLKKAAKHKIYKGLKKNGHQGLVLFHQGLQKKSKAAVHDVIGILEKFKIQRHNLRS